MVSHGSGLSRQVLLYQIVFGEYSVSVGMVFLTHKCCVAASYMGEGGKGN